MIKENHVKNLDPIVELYDLNLINYNKIDKRIYKNKGWRGAWSYFIIKL